MMKLLTKLGLKKKAEVKITKAEKKAEDHVCCGGHGPCACGGNCSC